MSEVTFSQWCIVELMGHVRMAGLLTEAEHFGAKLGRLDIPQPDGTLATTFFGGASVYRISPTTEAIARAVALLDRPAPVHHWELPAPQSVGQPASMADQDDDDDDEIERDELTF